MSCSYALRLPFPPSVNTYYRRAGFTVHLSKQAREFHKRCEELLPSSEDGPICFGRVGVSMELSSPTRRRYDVDGRVKAVLDALEGVYFADDEQVDQLVVKRLPVASGTEGHCDVIVTELS